MIKARHTNRLLNYGYMSKTTSRPADWFQTCERSAAPRRQQPRCHVGNKHTRPPAVAPPRRAGSRAPGRSGCGRSAGVAVLRRQSRRAVCLSVRAAPTERERAARRDGVTGSHCHWQTRCLHAQNSGSERLD